MVTVRAHAMDVLRGQVEATRTELIYRMKPSEPGPILPSTGPTHWKCADCKTVCRCLLPLAHVRCGMRGRRQP